MTGNATRSIELLSPARNAETGIEAIRHGADAVYIGAPKFGAREAAANSIEDIKRLTDYAHVFNAKVYATLNTILYDSELQEAREMACRLFDVGVDALLVQDAAFLEMRNLPRRLNDFTKRAFPLRFWQESFRLRRLMKFISNVPKCVSKLLFTEPCV